MMVGTNKTRRKNSQMKEIIGRLFRNKAAIVGLVILLVLVVCAVLQIGWLLMIMQPRT